MRRRQEARREAPGRVVFGALLAVLALAAVPYGSVEDWWTALFQCAAFALGIVWAVDDGRRRGLSVRGVPLVAPLLCLLLFAYVQTLPLLAAPPPSPPDEFARKTVSADPFATWQFVLLLASLVLFGQLLLRYTSDEGRVRALVLTVVGVGVASALFGIARQFAQAAEVGFILPHLERGRGYGQYVNRNHFAYLMEMSLGLVLGLAAGSRRDRERLAAYVALAALLSVALVLSNSRGGVFSMAGQFLFFFLVADFSRPGETAAESKGRRRGRGVKGRGWRRLAARATLAGLLLSVAAGLVVVVGGDRLAARLESLPNEAAAGEAGQRLNVSRAEIWRATWRLIKEHPVAGVGFGGYGVAVSKYHDASGELVPEKAHNDYLELLASGGVVGLALGVWFAAAFFAAARRSLRASPPALRPARLGALTGICGVAIHSAVDFGLHLTANALVFTALAVIATREAGRESGTREAEAAASVSQKMPLPGEEMPVDRPPGAQ